MFVKLKKILFLRLQTTDDSLAQQVEHLPFKQRVPSSSLGRITFKPFLLLGEAFLFYEFSAYGALQLPIGEVPNSNLSQTTNYYLQCLTKIKSTELSDRYKNLRIHERAKEL